MRKFGDGGSSRKENKIMKALGKRVTEMRKSAPTAVSKAEEGSAGKTAETPKQKINPDLGNASFKDAFRTARGAGDKTFMWRGKSYTTQLATEAKPAAPTRRSAPQAEKAASPTPKPEAKANPNSGVSRVDFKGLNKPAAPATPAAPAKRNIDRFNLDKVRTTMDQPARRSPLYAGDEKLKAAQERAAAAQRGYAKGGKVKKFKNAGPVMESSRKPIDTRRSVLGSDKEIVGRGNRTPYEPVPKTGPEKPKQKLGRAGAAGYKTGGSVMKKSDKAGRALVKKSADTMGRAMVKKACGGKAYAKGGLVAGHKSADGIAKKGKTKGKMC